MLVAGGEKFESVLTFLCLSTQPTFGGQHLELQDLVQSLAIVGTVEASIKAHRAEFRPTLLAVPYQGQRRIDIVLFPDHSVTQDELIGGVYT